MDQINKGGSNTGGSYSSSSNMGSDYNQGYNQSYQGGQQPLYQNQPYNYQPYSSADPNWVNPSSYNYNYQHPPQQLGFNTGAQQPAYFSQAPYPGAPAYSPNQSSYPGGAQQPAYFSQPPYPGAPAYSSQAPYQSNTYGQPAQPQYNQQQPFSGNHQPGMYSNPSIRPYPHFNAQHDADALRNAMKGLGCNNNRVIEVLCGRSNAQRQDIARVFKTMYGKDLITELKSELRGDFEEFVLALMENPVKYDADQLFKAMARIGTRENVLIEIMTSRTNAQIFQLKQVYGQIYGRDLEGHLVSETSGYFKRLLVSMSAGGRDESNQIDPIRANQDARKLYRAGEQRLGTDEAQFSAIIAAQNFSQLRLVFDEYQKITGRSIEQAINNEFSGDIRDGLLAIIKAIRNRPAYFAELLHASMSGLGTRDTDLVRIIVTRSEVDLADIRNEYHRIYGKSLEQAIAGDCSGSYKAGLIALVKGN